MQQREKQPGRAMPRINFRPLVFCALGAVFGIFLYFRIRFGGLRPSDFLFFAVFLLCAAVPLSWKRVGVILIAFCIFAGAGVLSAHLYSERFLAPPDPASYDVEGTVVSFTPQDGRTRVILDDLKLDGVPVGGKLSASVGGEAARAGDILSFHAFLSKNEAPMSGSTASEYDFYSDIRFYCGEVSAEKIGEGRPLLRLRSALYDTLSENIGGTEAQVAYALLTGSSSAMDAGLLSEVRRGGIAHIFAVSGLHIGILFGAAMLLFRPLRRYAVLPASVLALLYCAFCGFTVSSVRAVVMCTVMGAYRAFGRKYDFPQAIALAALPLLLFSPADFLSAGFRLSFGACIGLALFSGSLQRLFSRIPHAPAFLVSYFSANLSVQLFTFPILLETFGYFSWWGFVLNLFLIPLLPVLFLVVLVFSLLALCIPPAAAFFLAFPKGALSLFLLVLSWGEFTAVLTGFSLGTGGAVYLTGSFLLSERFRLRPAPRAVLAGALAVLFTFLVVINNVVFAGAKLVTCSPGHGHAALLTTPTAHVLVIDGEISLSDCEDFLSRNYGGTLDGVIVLSDDELDGINCAAFLDTDAVYARDPVPTGLREHDVTFGERAEIGGLTFTFFTREKLSVEGEGVVVEIDFTQSEALGADLFVDAARGGLIFFFRNGIIKEL